MDAGAAGVQSTNQFSMTKLKWQSFPCQQPRAYATLFAINIPSPQRRLGPMSHCRKALRPNERRDRHQPALVRRFFM